jgi:hypothetical protein
VDDAKAMFAYTDAIPSLLSMLFDDGDRDEERQAADPGLHDDPAAASLVVVKSLLVNATLEKRNAQLVCAGDSHGLDSLMSYALENEDVLAMKIARNIAGHPGTTQAMFAVFFNIKTNFLKKIAMFSQL